MLVVLVCMTSHDIFDVYMNIELFINWKYFNFVQKEAKTDPFIRVFLN